MQLNSTKPIETSTTLSRAEVKKLLKQKGFTAASYARMVKKSKSAISHIMAGSMTSGPLRERFAKFLGVDESMLPRRGEPS